MTVKGWKETSSAKPIKKRVCVTIFLSFAHLALLSFHLRQQQQQQKFRDKDHNDNHDSRVKLVKIQRNLLIALSITPFWVKCKLVQSPRGTMLRLLFSLLFSEVWKSKYLKTNFYSRRTLTTDINVRTNDRQVCFGKSRT